MSSIETEVRKPDVSLVVPCYNEEGSIRYTLPELSKAFRKAGLTIELIAVDNGSSDQTGAIIQELATEDPSIVYHRVEKNQGYGYGILRGLELCSADWVGSIPADGQIDAEDVVKLYKVLASSDGWVLGKVRRRFRMDGFRRRVVSVCYNLFVCALWPGLGSIDINGSPKILPKRALKAMSLESKGWLLDPEIMIKAYYLNLPVIELNVCARMRGSGVSHVNMATCFEFFFKLLSARFFNPWKHQLELGTIPRE